MMDVWDIFNKNILLNKNFYRFEQVSSPYRDFTDCKGRGGMSTAEKRKGGEGWGLEVVPLQKVLIPGKQYYSIK